MIFGDHGAVIQQTADPNQPDTRLQKIQTTTLASIRRSSRAPSRTAATTSIFGNLGRDTIVAGAGHDMADGDEADDMRLRRQRVPAAARRRGGVPGRDRLRRHVDTTSGRFQTLCGTLLYSRTDRPNACAFGNPVGSDTSGLLLVNGVWQPYRDPDSPGARHARRGGPSTSSTSTTTTPTPTSSTASLLGTTAATGRARAASATTTSPAARRTT